MKLIPNADKRLSELLIQKSTKAYYLALCEAINRKYETVFANHMQNYVTRLGISISELSLDRKIKAHTFLGSIDFLCLSILKNQELYNHLRAMDINDQSNNGKHSVEDISININECLHQYNRLISELVNHTHLESLKVCYLSNKSKPNFRDSKIIPENQSHKYGMVANFKYEIKLSPEYRVDPFSKTITVKMTIFWYDQYPKHAVNITIYNKSTNNIISEIKNVDVSSKGKQEFALKLKANELNRRLLEVKINIELLTQKTHSYTTGALWWKEYHSYDFFDSSANKTEFVSQLLSREIK